MASGDGVISLGRSIKVLTNLKGIMMKLGLLRVVVRGVHYDHPIAYYPLACHHVLVVAALRLHTS